MPYKAPNAKGVRHDVHCLHDEPGVTICTCDPIRSTVDATLAALDESGTNPEPGTHPREAPWVDRGGYWAPWDDVHSTRTSTR